MISAVGADVRELIISRIGFTPDISEGSFDISSGFERSAENRSPPPDDGLGVEFAEEVCSSDAGASPVREAAIMPLIISER